MQNKYEIQLESMIIRATKKLLNNSGINYGEIEEIQSDALLSSGSSGKFETPTEILHRLVDAL